MEERSPKPVGLVLGMMGNKDAAGFLEHFAAWSAASSPCRCPVPRERPTIPPRWPPSPRAPASRPRPAADVEDAIRRLQKAQGGPLRILICGSLYLAGHVLALQEGVQAQAN